MNSNESSFKEVAGSETPPGGRPVEGCIGQISLFEARTGDPEYTGPSFNASWIPKEEGPLCPDVADQQLPKLDVKGALDAIRNQHSDEYPWESEPVDGGPCCRTCNHH